jgi:hypothetical protein
MEDMAEPVALLTFQLALAAWSSRNRVSIATWLRAASTALYGRQLKPWQVRAYRWAALGVLALTLLYDAVVVLRAS